MGGDGGGVGFVEFVGGGLGVLVVAEGAGGVGVGGEEVGEFALMVGELGLGAGDIDVGENGPGEGGEALETFFERSDPGAGGGEGCAGVANEFFGGGEPAGDLGEAVAVVEAGAPSLV